MKTILLIATLLLAPIAWADSSPIDCAVPKKPAVKRKPSAKPVPLRIKPLVSEDLCPAAPVVQAKPEPEPTAVVVEEPPASPIDMGPTFAGIAGSNPAEVAAPVEHITYVPTLVPGGILPVPVYITERVTETVYVDHPAVAPSNDAPAVPAVPLPPSFDAPSAGVPVSPVPEPSTYALMLGGLALLGFVARRKGGAA
jgi:hypothetical protein